MKLIQIKRPYLFIQISQKELDAIHIFLESLAVKLTAYDATATAVKINEEIVRILDKYENSKIEKKEATDE